MSKHTTALVSLESWCYNSPELRSTGKSVDLGLLAEALIYYDCVLANVPNPLQFAELLRWFIAQNKYADFLALVKEGALKIYDYGFTTNTLLKDGVYSIWNIQDEIQARPNTFEERFLYHESVESCLGHSQQREKLYKALRGNVIEAKANEFGNAIENARYDFNNPTRNALIIQAFVDELYAFKGLGKPPKVNASVVTSPDGNQKNITWNINFDELKRIAGESLNFHPGTPLTAGAVSNRLLWSSASMGCDLYLSQPISLLVGDKLYESESHLDRTHSIIDTLIDKVEFPDLRFLVNSGHIGLDEVLRIRKKARKFRTWLQDESDRDRDALIAYHHEVAKEAGYKNLGRKALSLFGVIGGGVLGSTVGSLVGSLSSGLEGAAVGGAAGGAAGSAMRFLFDVASKLGADSNWKPVVFGNWYKSRRRGQVYK